MNNRGNVGITAIPLLISFLLIGATASTVMLGDQDSIALDANQTVRNVVDELTKYLKIDDAIGKYYTFNGVRSVKKIVIQIKQIFQNTINMSEVKIKIINENDVMILGYSGHAVECNSGSLFEHRLWDTTNNTFGLIVLIDQDRSLIDHNVMNEDTAFIAIKLPDQFAMKNRESITISITPPGGRTSSVSLETPSFHSSNIISFGKV